MSSKLKKTKCSLNLDRSQQENLERNQRRKYMQQRKAVDFAELLRQGVSPVMMPSVQESYVKKC